MCLPFLLLLLIGDSFGSVPIIINEFEQFSIGDTLHLICTADYPLEWSLPDNRNLKGYSDPTTDGRLVSVDGFRAEITIVRLNYSDTGAYECRPKTSGRMKSIQRYIFVNGEAVGRPFTCVGISDGANGRLLLEWKSEWLIINYNQDSVVPCRSTSKGVQVELYVDDRIQSDRVQKNYDPRMGFLVKPSDLTIEKMHSGRQAKCRALFQSESGQVVEDELKFMLTVIEQSEHIVPKMTTNCTFPYRGVTIQFTCTVHTVQSFSVTFQWAYPSSVEKYRVGEPKSRRIRTGVQSELIVRNLRSTDSGLYFCTAFQGGFSNETNIRIGVSETRGRLEIAENSEKNIILNKQRIVSPISGKTEAKLVPNQRINITSRKDGPFDMEQMEMFSEKVHILNTTVQDSGIYILLLETGDDLHRSFEFAVSIRSSDLESIISISDSVDFARLLDGRFLQLGSLYYVRCVLRVVPSASVVLRRKACISSTPLSSCPDRLYTSVPSHFLVGTYESARNFSFIAHTSSTVECSAKNRSGRAERRLIVTDVDNAHSGRGMDILLAFDRRIGESIYEGDRVALICRTQKYDLSMVAWYLVQFGQESQIATRHESSTGFTVHYNDSSAYSNRLTLYFGGITLQQSGLYRCKANLRGQWAPVRKDRRLDVESPVRPYFLNRSSPSSPLVVRHQQPVVISCPGHGRPSPQIDWFKDGKAVVFNGGIRNSVDNRTVTIARVVGDDGGRFQCRVANFVGTVWNNVTLEVVGSPTFLSKSATTTLIIGSMAIVLVIFCLLLLLIREMHRRRRQQHLLADLHEQLIRSSLTSIDRKLLEQLDPNIPLNHQADDLPYDRKYELCRELLQLGGPLLGQGQFGRVVRGTLNTLPAQPHRQEPLAVAVKVPQNGRSVRDQKVLLDELKIMIALGRHVNVLTLIGAITKRMGKGELFVVTEFCQIGNLRDYVRENRAVFLNEIVVGPQLADDQGYLAPQRLTKTTTVYQAEQDDTWASQLDANRGRTSMLTTSDLLSFAYQAANGMDYLAQKTLLHRDLAARNLLLTSSRVVKIADFGLARRHEQYHMERPHTVPLPVRWLAPESIVDQDFSVKSDVWSFGVVLWEMFSLGETPYSNRVLDPTFVAFLTNGGRMIAPTNAPGEIYQLMRDCWNSQPTSRPSFGDCRLHIGAQLARCSGQLFAAILDLLRYDESTQIGNYYSSTADERKNGSNGTTNDHSGPSTKRGFLPIPTSDPDSVSVNNRYKSLPMRPTSTVV